MMKFKDWINKKFIDWRGDSRRGITDYARFIGVSQPTMSSWLGGVIPSAPHNVAKLFTIYGEEIYDNGISRKKEPLSSLPPYLRRRLLNAQREIENTFKTQGITGEMPEAEEVAMQIMERHGFIYKTTREVPDSDK